MKQVLIEKHPDLVPNSGTCLSVTAGEDVTLPTLISTHILSVVKPVRGALGNVSFIATTSSKLTKLGVFSTGIEQDHGVLTVSIMNMSGKPVLVKKGDVLVSLICVEPAICTQISTQSTTDKEKLSKTKKKNKK